MVVIPLVFSSLVLGIVELKDLSKLGRVGIKTLIYTMLASTLSVLIGLSVVSLVQPGRGLDPTLVQQLTEKTASSVATPSPKSAPEILVSLIPKNPLEAAVRAFDGEMISFMVFALLFGIALLAIRPKNEDNSLINALETIRQVSMKLVDYAMKLAPLGVAGLMFTMTATFGIELVGSLAKYVFTVLGALAFQQFVVYSVILKVFAKKSPRRFFSQIREVMVTAFSTASSNATLPTALRVAETELKLNRSISNFVLTIGAAANQNGTALFEGITVLFLAQIYGITLGVDQQVVVLFMSVLAGIGTAGVPGGSIPLIIIVLQSVGIPAEGIGLILGVDRILDMCRTVLNVSGDIVCAEVICASEERQGC
jgi:DAACS family dicarboxylate/amino acid:cation (Na+ or H+) symporter